MQNDYLERCVEKVNALFFFFFQMNYTGEKYASVEGRSCSEKLEVKLALALEERTSEGRERNRRSCQMNIISLRTWAKG